MGYYKIIDVGSINIMNYHKQIAIAAIFFLSHLSSAALAGSGVDLELRVKSRATAPGTDGAIFDNAFQSVRVNNNGDLIFSNWLRNVPDEVGTWKLTADGNLSLVAMHRRDMGTRVHPTGSPVYRPQVVVSDFDDDGRITLLSSEFGTDGRNIYNRSIKRYENIWMTDTNGALQRIETFELPDGTTQPISLIGDRTSSNRFHPGFNVNDWATTLQADGTLKGVFEKQYANATGATSRSVIVDGVEMIYAPNFSTPDQGPQFFIQNDQVILSGNFEIEGQPQTRSSRLLKLNQDGTFKTLHHHGDPLPNTDLVLIDFPDTTSSANWHAKAMVNENGQFLMTGRLRNGSSYTYNTAIYLGDPDGNLTEIAMSGQDEAITDELHFFRSNAKINKYGKGAFHADDKLWTFDQDGNLEVFLEPGDAAPGTNATIERVFFSDIADNGQILFVAYLDEPDPYFGGDTALYATDENGDPQLILRRGDFLDVSLNPNTENLWQVHTYGYGRLNESGIVNVTIETHSGRQALFTATVTPPSLPIPTPSTSFVLLVGIGMLALSRFRQN